MDRKYTQKEMAELIEKWQNTDPKLYKTNIRHLCRFRGITYNQIMPHLNVSHEAAKSYYNASHKAKIEILTALKLAELLGVNIEVFLKTPEKVEEIYSECIDNTQHSIIM